jgi:8-amino-7-oxononanoate synthase
LRGSSHFRFRRLITPIDSTHVELDGRRLINFASNDYLGLARHPAVIAAASGASAVYGVGSGASPLISGYGPAHRAAETRIAQWKGAESAVLLPSGYQANHAAVETITAIAKGGGRGFRFLLDKLCHASLVDAVRAVDAPFRVFPHNRLSRLSKFLGDCEKDQIQIVVTESIFSMDGDAADLEGLARLKQEYGFVLLLDEAHSSGIYGKDGRGLPDELCLPDLADVTVVTLSKAIGCAGGAVCGSQVFCESLVNLARAYVFSTSVAPGTAAGAAAAIEVMATEPWRRQRLRDLALRVRTELAARAFELRAGDSPIIPIILGSEGAALDAAAHLLAKGILSLAIRPPTVPRGTSRLRITLSSEHRDEDVTALLAAVGSLPMSRPRD